MPETFKYIAAALFLGYFSPWIFLVITIVGHRRQERLWREQLVLLKSSSAYEAQDTLDRMRKRETPVIKQVVANLAKQEENLAESDPLSMDEDMRMQLEKRYGNPD